MSGALDVEGIQSFFIDGVPETGPSSPFPLRPLIFHIDLLVMG